MFMNKDLQQLLRKNLLIMAARRKHVKVEYEESDNENAGNSSGMKNKQIIS